MNGASMAEYVICDLIVEMGFALRRDPRNRCCLSGIDLQDAQRRKGEERCETGADAELKIVRRKV